MKNQNKTLFIVFIIVITIGSFWFFQSSRINEGQIENPGMQEENSGNDNYHEGWLTSETEKGKFQYPSALNSKYISLVDWPPVLNIVEEPFSCVEAGEETERAGKTEIVNVNGSQYCRTTIVEGAAGSIYGQYAFAFEKDDKVVILTFSLRFPQCYNYDEPAQQECLFERDNFDLDGIINQIANTIEI